jgi:tetratricopeptide (TPR) repeat protein
MRICATVITGNAGDIIVDGIQSAMELADDFLLIDTGINDDTIDKAKELLGDRLHICQFTWCNPIPQRMNWIGQTHECFIGYNTAEFARIERGKFFEVPKTPEQLEHKYQRDLDILTRTCQTDPNDARWWYYLGQTNRALNKKAEAIDAYKMAIGIQSASRPQRACAAYCAATIAFGEQDYEIAIELCCRGLACDPNWPELFWLAGLCCYHQKRFQEAIGWCEACIALGHYTGSRSGRNRVILRHLPAWFETPFEVLRFVYRAMGEIEKAEQMEIQYLLAKAKREKSTD